jgi:D-arabinose 1-dehydrogenase-like Zn-dependent alcohol dehydrogenase
MRATILEAPHQPLKVVDLPVPEAAPEQVPIRTQVTAFLLTEANEALDALRAGKLDGAAVLIMD